MDKIINILLESHKNKKYDEMFNYIYENYKIFMDIVIQIQSKNNKNKNEENGSSKSNDNKNVYYKQTNLDDLLISFEKDSSDIIFMLIFKYLILDAIDATTEYVVYGKDEMVHNDNKFPRDISYRITTTDNEINTKKFASYILIYTIDSVFSTKLFLGIDYEFNSRQIALMQLNFECNHAHETKSYIFMIDPTELERHLLEFFISSILENNKIIRILHGADPLDIPYTFADLLNNDEESIVKFTNGVVDTRFLCEYARTIKAEKQKCSIYVALHYFNTIDDKAIQMLESTHDEMGPIETITWNIYELNDAQKKYGMYDVLYLKKYYYDILAFAKKYDDERTFKYYIPELTRMSYLEKRKVTNMLEELKVITDRMNFNVIKKKDKNTGQIKKIKFSDIYADVMDKLVINNPTVEINKLMTLNYLRKTIAGICKYIIYSSITHNFNVYMKNDEQYKKKLYISFINDYFEKYGFRNLITFSKFVSLKSGELIMNYAKYA
jgi:hypothetical protein